MDMAEFTKEQCGICAECVPQINGGSGFTNRADAHAAETAGDKMQLTREWLEHTISGIEAIRDEIPFGLDADEENTLSALKLALATLTAGMEQEPVAWVRYCSDGTIDGPLLNYQIDDCRKSTWTPLYAAPRLPQPAVGELTAETLPDEIKQMPAATAFVWMDGWNKACRAAMLQVAEPVHGWIPCSERMPEDEQEVLTRNKMGHCFVSFFDEHSGLFFDRIDVAAACCIEHILVTHWMPLPEPPQEAT